MKKLMVLVVLSGILSTAKAQLIDWNKLNLDNLVGKALQVKKGWAPKFSLGNLDISKIAQVSKIINLKNVQTATKLFNTFKTGRSIYKIGSYVGLATSAYSSVKNIVESNKETITAEAKKLKSDAIKKAQTFLAVGGVSIATGLIIKFLTKKAAYKATDAFNGVIKKKIRDILSFDAPQYSPYTTAGIALKLKL
jgi:hypothetical protein